ncbi:deoxyribonuclease NucA/NucB family protein [Burkholderia pseudomallei MSHR2990]|uniref:NucA/NucB deoxyribonuclease domain-containing protein n=1 Tax=Burkholderia pseudomallei TaxID=28450 RepID=UPI0005370FBC|nr:NucA/NucB deoxyribonuclease domain-containing protein [Burkholderia pseudomallei]KGW74899.1 deoxyribonuclease NucA/NucB family protein [Burkholderia pseudomallei MSHR2990]
MKHRIGRSRLFAGALLCVAVTQAHAESATDVSPICTKVTTEATKDSLLSRGAHCQKSVPLEYVVKDEQNAEIGRVAIDAYAYSDNPSNQLAWTLKFRFRTRFVSGSAGGLIAKPVVECGTDCTVAPNAGVPLAVGSLSNEVSVTITPNMRGENPLRISPTIEYRVAKSGDSLEDGTSVSPYAGVGYIPEIRCDVGLAKSGTQGCVYPEAPAILRTITAINPDVDESAIHIREAQAAGRPGRFVPRGDGTIFPDTWESKPLTRTRDAVLRRDNRTASKKQCMVIYGSVNGQCTFTGDPDETPTDCDCDEYPFASTEQGASREEVSVKRIDASDNRRAGAFLGNFYLSQRVLDAEKFYVDVDSQQSSLKR